MNQDSAEGLVGNGQRGCLTVLDGKVVGCGIQLEALCRLNLHRIIIPSVQIDMDTAIIAGGDGIHQTAVTLTNLEGYAGNSFSFVRFGYFYQFQTANRRVVERQSLYLAGLDLHALRRTVQDIAVNRLCLLCGDDGARG